MDKTIIVYILALVFPFSIQAQDWTTIATSDLGVQGYWWSPPTGRKSFKINRQNNDIWWARQFSIYNINPQGLFTTHSNATDSNLPPTANVSFQEVEFLNDDVFVINDNSGFIYKYDDNTQWSHYVGPTDAVFMSVEEDSLWVCRIGENLQKYVNDIPTNYPDGQRRIQSRNGHAWSCGTLAGNGLDVIRYYEPLTFDYRSADTAEFILDNYINDFKFMNNSDTFFLAGNQGFSIALGSQFIDTLTSYNTINQPSGRIIEFEFDQDDNVWALFGSSITSINSLAYLDRSTNEWLQFYDENNSPIQFGGLVSIELDNQGNVYIITNDKLHILEVGMLPSWLNLESPEQVKFEVYPNPSNGQFTIQIDEDVLVTDIEVVDSKGMIIDSMPFSKLLRIELSSGLYYLKIINDQEVIGAEKLIIN
ncbi:MAG: T9SS type A sorting domain-containing protein [Fluviicola sp.]